ncbi:MULTISPECIES: ACP S-malonyltransferase [Ralstonia solanacearum species complex]|uniref:Malonyl CoA-acyl carrier protein transacylase n=4 Tax=Ralstonia solanacearum species complex TaxID=3116862 RepID=A0A0S4VB56_RALSL|nr:MULTISPECIES: ACP S-malonyltransferase [Ralstonia]AOE89130.1 [Acyl-carrier-protein] S-malonyltransferase [Ralstonia solanacearum]APC68092.1 [acyl-carrier-protein] S-malonyltransferase [Ralstonia solanacearum OE1-1]API75262.1 malonyl CoA-acyl carrier protein transacylase [Ralstonia pseudosolanacearum]ASL72397.1 [acyl-carrier-protein] S-malonyltransferase [Ralstonia pseudosolanacearum]AST26679.1 malonyl CoA-acyl carrier protein transacylase [Ralstonia pseudosolanacearum]
MTFAFVFPGQGSQSVGMLNAFADHPVVAATLAEASDALGQDIGKLIAEGPADELNLTTNTQPVMLTAAVAVYRAWQAAGGPTPAVVAGHSLGEYSALVAAGAIAFKDAVPLVRFRAKAMQEAVPVGEGGMAAILGLSDDDVRAACAEASSAGVVEAVNFNAPAQVVIAGAKAAVEKACEIAKAKGAKRALPLPVSAPFHSSLLKPASDRLREYLSGVAVGAPAIPVINNVDVALVSDPAAIKDALVRQAASPVRWVETVQKMKADGIARVVECGPGKVLAGLTKRIDGDIVGDAIFDPASLEAVLVQLK